MEHDNQTLSYSDVSRRREASEQNSGYTERGAGRGGGVMEVFYQGCEPKTDRAKDRVRSASIVFRMLCSEASKGR